MKNVNYCCERFKESVEADKVILKATDTPDETEWYLNEGSHIYYCPFCGAFIKGDGFGNYNEQHPPQTKPSGA